MHSELFITTLLIDSLVLIRRLELISSLSCILLLLLKRCHPMGIPINLFNSIYRLPSTVQWTPAELLYPRVRTVRALMRFRLFLSDWIGKWTNIFYDWIRYGESQVEIMSCCCLLVHWSPPAVAFCCNIRLRYTIPMGGHDRSSGFREGVPFCVEMCLPGISLTFPIWPRKKNLTFLITPCSSLALVLSSPSRHELILEQSLAQFIWLYWFGQQHCSP